MVAALRARAPVRGAGVRRLPAGRPVKARLFTDGGSRGNPGPAAYGYVLEAEDGTVLDARGEAIGVATNNVAEYSALVAGLERRSRRRRRARGRLRLRAPRQADAWRVPGEERALCRISSSRPRASRGRSSRDVHGGPPRAQRAGGQARQRGARPGHAARARRGAAILRLLADVAQLARASACHAEGRGFESLHPLRRMPR